MARAFLGLVLLAVVIVFAAAMQDRQETGVAGRVWSPEHGHWHDVR